MDSLSDDVVELIFSHLSVVDTFRARRVSKQWKILIDRLRGPPVEKMVFRDISGETRRYGCFNWDGEHYVYQHILNNWLNEVTVQNSAIQYMHLIKQQRKPSSIHANRTNRVVFEIQKYVNGGSYSASYGISCFKTKAEFKRRLDNSGAGEEYTDLKWFLYKGIF
jgi:hypothetical protein